MFYETEIEDLVTISDDEFFEEGYFESSLRIPDKRRFAMECCYPYDCIGLVISYFKNNPNPIYGTGFLKS